MMKQHTLYHLLCVLAICSLLCCHTWGQKEHNMIDFRGNPVSIDTTQKNIIFCISSIACHECFRQLGIFFRDAELTKKDNVKIIAMANMPFEEFNSVGARKYLKRYIEPLFDSLPHIYYHNSDKEPLYGQKTDDRLLPVVFLVDKRGVQYFARDTIFEERTMRVNNNFKILLLEWLENQ